MKNAKGTMTYAYKSDELRLSKDVNGAKTTHTWDRSNIVLDSGAKNDVYLRRINLIKSDSNSYYVFNAHDDVVQLANNSSTLTKVYLYDANGNLASVTDLLGNKESYEYDKLNRVSVSADANGNKTILKYDMAGQLLEIIQIDKNNAETISASYSYDPQGNVINSTEKNFAATEALVEITNNKYNNLNQLISKTVKNIDGNIINDYAYSFDKRGNLVKEVDTKNANRTKTYTYDSTNKMTQGTNENGETSEYTYNGLDMLVKNTTQTKNNSTIIKDYVIDYTSNSNNELMSFESTGLNYRYIYGNQKIATNIIDTKSSNSLQLYIQNDKLGSGKYASDINGNIVAHTYLDEWGNQLEKVKAKLGTTSVDVLNNYTNHNYDDILGIYYAKARMYDPVNKRFMSTDPIKGDIMNPQTMNPYIYVLNSPLVFVDPLGMYARESDPNYNTNISKGYSMPGEQIYNEGFMPIDTLLKDYVANDPRISYIARVDEKTKTAYIALVTSKNKKTAISWRSQNDNYYAEASFSVSDKTLKLDASTGQYQINPKSFYSEFRGFLGPNQNAQKRADILLDSMYIAGLGASIYIDMVPDAGNKLYFSILNCTATKSDFISNIENKQKDATKKLSFSGGAQGEKWLEDTYGGRSQVQFKTSQGIRYVDQVSNKIAYESKVGQVVNSELVRSQIMKDAELLSTGQVDDVVWHFFESANTGKIGPVDSVLKMLQENGIEYIIHN